MSKDDKTRTDLSHLGPPAIARRFSQVSPRDEIAKFERVPVAELGKSTLRSVDVALAESSARIKILEGLLAMRDEALAAALAKVLELTQRNVTATSGNVTCSSCEAKRKANADRVAKHRKGKADAKC